MPCGMRTISESTHARLHALSSLPLPPLPLSLTVFSTLYLLFSCLLCSPPGILVSSVAHGPTWQLSQSHIPIWLNIHQYLNDRSSMSHQRGTDWSHLVKWPLLDQSVIAGKQRQGSPSTNMHLLVPLQQGFKGFLRGERKFFGKGVWMNRDSGISCAPLSTSIIN